MYLGTGDAMSLSNEEKITLARSAAPDFISQNAKVVDEKEQLLMRELTLGLHAGDTPKYENPMCNDPGGRLMAALNAKEPFSTDTLGFSYMLQGDAPIDNDDLIIQISRLDHGLRKGHIYDCRSQR